MAQAAGGVDRYIRMLLKYLDKEKFENIEKIANKYGLKVLYDAAHAFGVQYKGRGITSYGDMSILSFHATKVYNTIEGGAICYNDEEYKTKLYRLRDFGIASEEVVDAIGANAKMNEFCAAMGLCNLKYVNQEIEKRKEVVNRYRENLNNVDGIKLLPVQKDVVANYSYFPIVINEKDFGATRNEVFEKLKDNNIFARKYFYPCATGGSGCCTAERFAGARANIVLHGT